MQRFVCICLLLAVAQPVSSADFWVLPTNRASEGNGSAAEPYRTIAQAAKRARKGDTIHLWRKAIYRETGIAINGATVVAEGPVDQPYPVISGATAITGFKPLPENSKILAADCAEKPAFCATKDGMLTLARYPNDGFLSTKPGTTANTLIDADLSKRPPGRSWVGAQLRWRKWSWWWETRTIVEDTGNRLQLGPSPVSGLDNLVGIGSGYYVDDCRAELDAPGEWWFDADKKQLLIIPPTGVDARTLIVEAAIAGKSGISLSEANLKGVTFRHFATSAVTIGHTSTVDDCVFEQLGDTGLASTWDCSGSVVRHCQFTDILNTGINWIENPGASGGSIIEHNRFERIGMREGLGGSGTWHAVGVTITNGKAVAVRQNTFKDIGYCGIILGADGQVVEHNVLIRCMCTMNDGAAIYANCNGSIIRENIILNTVGNLQTSQPFYPLGHGIWPEFLKEFRDTVIVANTVVGCGGNGLFLPNNFTCDIRDNVLAGNRLAGIALGIENNNRRPQKHTLTNNILVVDSRFRSAPAKPENIPTDWKGNDRPTGISYDPAVDYGTATGTVAIAAQGTDLARSGGKGFKDAASWKADANWGDASAKVVRAEAVLLINDGEQSTEMMVPPGTWLTTNGERFGKSVKIEPFRSVVLVSVGPVPPTVSPYTLASSRDVVKGASPHDGKGREGRPTGSAMSGDGVSAGTHSTSIVTGPAAEFNNKPTAAAKTLFLQRLKDGTASAIAEGRFPRFYYLAMKADVQVVALAGSQATLKVLPDSGTIQYRIFENLSPTEGLNLSRALLRQDHPEDHAAVAFYARWDGKMDLYKEHIALAGSTAESVKFAFPKE